MIPFEVMHRRTIMRRTCTFLLAFVAGIGSGDRLFAQGYLTKDGKLTARLKVVQLQGGFAGFTGMQFTIAVDGTWTSENVFNKKTTPVKKGKLTEKELAKLEGILKKYDLAGLPEKSGKAPGANPYLLTFEFGKRQARWVGQVPPRLDRTDPTGTVASRFAGLRQGIVELLGSGKK